MPRTRRLIPCPRCGGMFWPWERTDHARKYCSKTCAQPPPKPKPPKPQALPFTMTEEQLRVHWRAQYLKNRARLRVQRNKRRQDLRKIDAYREKERGWVRKWNKTHPEARRAMRKRTAPDIKRRRRARKRQVPCEAVRATVVYQRAGGLCGICDRPIEKGSVWHVDHYVPLAMHGTHTYDNVQPAHPECNVYKGARLVATNVQSATQVEVGG